MQTSIPGDFQKPCSLSCYAEGHLKLLHSKRPSRMQPTSLEFRALRGFGRLRGHSGEGGAELARFHLFLVLMEVCVDFDAAFLVFG